MIRTDIISETLKRMYSDEGFTLRQEETGHIYEEAIDLIDHNYTYTETGERIDSGDEATVRDYEDALAILGVKDHETD